MVAMLIRGRRLKRNGGRKEHKENKYLSVFTQLKKMSLIDMNVKRKCDPI